MANRNGDNIPPWRTPHKIGKAVPSLPFHLTIQLRRLYQFLSSLTKPMGTFLLISLEISHCVKLYRTLYWRPRMHCKLDSRGYYNTWWPLWTWKGHYYNYTISWSFTGCDLQLSTFVFITVFCHYRPVANVRSICEIRRLLQLKPAIQPSSAVADGPARRVARASCCSQRHPYSET